MMVDKELFVDEEGMEIPVVVPLSEQIGNLLDTFTNVEETFAASNKRVLHMDRLTQDLLHALELQEHDYHERARIANELKNCRVQRRPYKDVVSQTEAVIGFLKSPQGIKMVHQLENLRNLAQKFERTFSGRKYTPRVLTAEEYRNLGKKKSKDPEELQNG